MSTPKITKSYLKDHVYKVTGAAIEVHRALGPGLLESVYHKCLEHELTKRNIKFKSEMNVPVHYGDIKIDANVRCDLFVENILPVELKAAKKVPPLYDAQLLTYMKLLKVPLGLMLNFNVINLYKDGQKTMVNELFRNLPD